jgi:hypothetical protein
MSYLMNVTKGIIFFAFLALTLHQAFAQGVDNAEVALAASKAKTQNLQAFKSYSWKMRSEISLASKTQAIILNQFRFNHEGKLEVTNLSFESKIKKKRGLRGKKQAREIEKTKKFLEQAIALSLSYLIMSRGEMVDFFDKTVITDGENNTIVVQGKDVRVKNDQLMLHLDKDSYLDRKSIIKSEVDGTPILGEVVYRQMKNGPNYMARMVIEASKKNLKIVSESFDIIKQQ